MKTAQEENLGILYANEQLIAARKYEAKRSEHLPTVDGIVISHTISGSRNFRLGHNRLHKFWTSIEFTIYNGVSLVRVSNRQLRRLIRQTSYLNRRLTVIRDTRNLYRAVATDVVRVKARLKAIKSSTSALSSRTGYEVGTRNVVDVLQAQQRLFASQFDYADSDIITL